MVGLIGARAQLRTLALYFFFLPLPLKTADSFAFTMNQAT